MIRIITNTTFGYWNGSFVEPKTKNSPPFELNADREAELVSQGIAEFVNEEEHNAETEETIAAETEEAEEIELSALTLEELEAMKLEKLKEYAEPLGVKYEFGMKKAALAQRVFDEIHMEASETDPISFDPAQAIV